jgi:hypothetical protein
MHPILRLYEDVLPGGVPDIALPPLPRMIFVVHGMLTIGGRVLGEGQVWHGEGEVTIECAPACGDAWAAAESAGATLPTRSGAAVVEPGNVGATCWRFELAPSNVPDGALSGDGVQSSRKLAAPLATLPVGNLLWRGDSVAFPPGGCAYLHRHQGPGIRCLVEGAIRIDTLGHSTQYAPGDAWYEAGPDPVFAQAARDRPTRFVRVLILPRDLRGKSSIQYVSEADKAKPRSQEYKIFVDTPIAFRLA